MPSYVFIWQDNLLKSRRVQEAKWVGHAALNIGDHFSLGAKKDSANYVSWWPSKVAKFSWIGILLSYARLKSQEGTAQPSFPADVVCEKYLPDHIVELPTNAREEQQMVKAWNSFVSTFQGKYNSVWKNCSTMVATILAGAGLHQINRKMWTPTLLHQVVSAIASSQHKLWADMVPVLEHGQEIKVKEDIVIGHARSGAYCTIGVPTLFQRDQRWSPQPLEKTK